MNNNISTDNQNSEIEFNGVKYIRKDLKYIRDLIPAASKPQNPSGEGLRLDIKIVVLQRGWVYVGYFTRDDGTGCKLTNASNIRVWGTTKGLPELVNGPTKATVLDKCDGEVEFDWLTVVHTITCNSAKWVNALM